MDTADKVLLRGALFGLYEAASRRAIVRWHKIAIPHTATAVGTWVDVRSHVEQWTVDVVTPTGTVQDLVRERFLDARVPELIVRAYDAGISLRPDDISLRVRLHVGECKTCSVKITALSVAVAFTVEGTLVSREYVV